jgi:hypothetical protein
VVRVAPSRGVVRVAPSRAEGRVIARVEGRAVARGRGTCGLVRGFRFRGSWAAGWASGGWARILFGRGERHVFAPKSVLCAGKAGFNV